MQIYDLIRDRSSLKRFESDQDEAYKQFVEQKSSIEWIANTRWFKVIKWYWQSVLVNCTERLRTAKIVGEDSDIKKVQGEMTAAMHFLDFLDNIQASDITPEEQELL